MIRTTKTTTYEVALGTSDCETCGPTWHSLQIEVVEYDDKRTYSANYSAGCFGGDSFPATDDLDELAVFLTGSGLKSEAAEALADIRKGLTK